ncbi:MAG: PAS-domain containing protein [Devosia sp.]|uniref:sensor histidine kinase n=1 Tax=Devosia sp. TaxID=1871048 RepID=UPI0024CAD5AE|nr:PAS domain-containing sensor histidine kinase [Devosia sp.]UYN99723.1 MAG: PAS-domain containing protein [Devosia sp.]
MRPSEASGAGAARFRLGNGHSNGRRRSPITMAVAATAFFAAGLFIVHDITRSFAETQRELGVIGTAIAAQILDKSPEMARATLDTTIGRFGAISRVDVIEGVERTTQPLSYMVPAGTHGALSVEAEEGAFIAGIAGRGGLALALAGLVTILSSRRRVADMPDPVQRYNYGQLASAIPMGIACWTKAGQLIVCNDRYRDRLDLAERDVTYHQAVARLVAGGYMKLVRDGDDSRLLELHREDGSCLLIDERPLDDGTFMTLVSDVTERKRTDALLDTIREDQRQLARRYHEEKLKAEAASRAKTNFLAHLSHDIRTPLNHIIGFAELMKHEAYGPLGNARYAEYVQTIKDSGEHLLDSFATILDLAELESGQKPLRQDPVSVDTILDDVARRFAPQMARAGIRLDRGVPCPAVLIGDRLGLNRMVDNVVENAVRFTPHGGTISLKGFAADDGVVIEVTDTGIGMNEERLTSLSQPFALGDATFTREGVGPGLGISISRALAELSGGNMAIDSSPSVGTTVAFSLPLARDRAAEAA